VKTSGESTCQLLSGCQIEHAKALRQNATFKFSVIMTKIKITWRINLQISETKVTVATVSLNIAS